MMNKDYIIYGLIIAVIYLLYKNSSNCMKIERMTNTEDIKQKINEIYQVDVESIRNLSAIAESLQKDGVTIPGDITIRGSLRLGDGSTVLTQSKGMLMVKNNNGSLTMGAKDSKNNYFETDRSKHIFSQEVRINGKAGYYQGKDF